MSFGEERKQQETRALMLCFTVDSWYITERGPKDGPHSNIVVNLAQDDVICGLWLFLFFSC